MSSPFYMLCICLVVILLFMSATWLLAQKIKNAGIVDVAWSLGFTIATAIYLYLARANSSSQWIVGLLTIIWSIRLTWHLAVRFARSYPLEDRRYTTLRQQMGDHAAFKMYLVFLFQGFVLVVLTAPQAVSIADSVSLPSFLHWFAIVIWLIAIIGESVADHQLSRFTAESANKGRTCRVGLWQYSRHPNYFFEWLGGVAFWLYSLQSPGGVWTIVSPLLLLHLLINVSGVKPAEKQSSHSRSDYAEYKKTTSPFVPWFKRKRS